MVIPLISCFLSLFFQRAKLVRHIKYCSGHISCLLFSFLHLYLTFSILFPLTNSLPLFFPPHAQRRRSRSASACAACAPRARFPRVQVCNLNPIFREGRPGAERAGSFCRIKPVRLRFCALGSLTFFLRTPNYFVISPKSICLLSTSTRSNRTLT